MLRGRLSQRAMQSNAASRGRESDLLGSSRWRRPLRTRLRRASGDPAGVRVLQDERRSPPKRRRCATWLRSKLEHQPCICRKLLQWGVRTLSPRPVSSRPDDLQRQRPGGSQRGLRQWGRQGEMGRPCVRRHFPGTRCDRSLLEVVTHPVIAPEASRASLNEPSNRLRTDVTRRYVRCRARSFGRVG